MNKYKLLKDLPGLPAGTIFYQRNIAYNDRNIYSGNSDDASVSYKLSADIIQNSPDFFELFSNYIHDITQHTWQVTDMALMDKLEVSSEEAPLPRVPPGVSSAQSCSHHGKEGQHCLSFVCGRGSIDFCLFACQDRRRMKQATSTIQEYELPITLHEEDGAHIATCALWQDCSAQGDTLEEAINEISSVAASVMELYKEQDMRIPSQAQEHNSERTEGLYAQLSFHCLVAHCVRRAS